MGLRALLPSSIHATAAPTTASLRRQRARSLTQPPLAAARKSASSQEGGQSPGPASPLRTDSRTIGRLASALSEDLVAPEGAALATGEQGAPLVPVEFRVTFQTRLGQDIHLVGSSPHLGEWSVAHACPLRWTSGGVWTTTVQLPVGGIFFYKFFMKEEGYLKEWQGGNNIMLVLPTTLADLTTLPLVAESSWTGAPSGSSLASEARVVARMHQVDALVSQAEAAARAAGLVAQTVMNELLTSREETAVAVRFIKDKGLDKEFTRAVGRDLLGGSDAAAAAPPGEAKAVGKGRGKGSSPPGVRPRTDAEIDAEIDATLAQQLSGKLDLSPPEAQAQAAAMAANQGRVDLSSADVFDAGDASGGGSAAPAQRAPRPLILNTDGAGDSRQTAR